MLFRSKDSFTVSQSRYPVPDNIEEIYIDTKDIVIKGNSQDNIFFSSENDDNIDAQNGTNTISYKNAKVKSEIVKSEE